MDASILLVGGDDFLFTLLNRVRNLVNCTVEVASRPSEAMPLIQAQQPDLILVQGSQPGGLELCLQVKAQARLAWIYCIALDLPEHIMPDAPLNHSWEIDLRTEALESGADSYLWLPQNAADGNPFPDSLVNSQDRLLRAEIIAGLRTVKNHRELMRTNDILSAIALSDPLTELNNRRAFDWELPRQIQNAHYRQEPLSLIMLDVDFFKNINDTYGHQIGDRTLQLVASRLRHNLRFRDTLFRYGGEEFVIILSGTDQQEAALVAHRLCHLIGDQPFTIDDNLDLTITISAGTASLQTDDDAKGVSLLKRADHLLLQAKAAGRNQAVSALEVGVDPSDASAAS